MGRALVDTPALDPASRAVLVPLSRPQLLPASVMVPGPGPIEPAPAPPPSSLKPAPAMPPSALTDDQDLIAVDDVVGESGRRSANETGEADTHDKEELPERGAADPYANLDGAFGSYLADTPQPIRNGRRGGTDLDDLLF